jgi:hypothetical protein
MSIRMRCAAAAMIVAAGLCASQAIAQAPAVPGDSPASYGVDASYFDYSYTSAISDDCGAAAACDNCCNGRRSRRLYAGVEATYLRADLEERGFEFFDDNNGFLMNSGDIELDDYYAAPRVWFGWENECGRGIRVRYWEYLADERVDLFDFDYDAQANLVDARLNEQVDAYTIDLEYTVHGCRRGWDLIGSFGVRHAHLGRNANYTYFNGDDDLYASMLLTNNFNGTGLTFGVEARRPTRNFESLSWYINLRGSVLWGDDNGYVRQILTDPIIELVQEIETFDQETLWVFDAQFGLEWSHYLECCQGTVFARGLIEYQWWEGTATDFIALQTDGSSYNFAQNLNETTQFYGATFSIGFER